MISKIATVMIGFGCLWYGFNILKEGWSHLYGYAISKGSGVIVLVFGFFLILYGCFRKARPKQDDEDFFIFPTCRKPFDRRDLDENQCPTCETELEKLDSYYDRHSELKEK